MSKKKPTWIDCDNEMKTLAQKQKQIGWVFAFCGYVISFINRAGMAIFLINAYCSALWCNRIKCCLLGDFKMQLLQELKK